MGARVMTNLLILGTAITGLILIGQVFWIEPPYPAFPQFMTLLGCINLATALFLAVVVRPLLQGRIQQSKFWTHTSLIVLLASWAAAFWVEYFLVFDLPSALSGAITWTVATLAYVVFLFVPEAPPQAPEAEAAAE